MKKTAEIISINSENAAKEGIVCVRGAKNQQGIDLKTEWQAKFRKLLDSTQK